MLVFRKGIHLMHAPEIIGIIIHYTQPRIHRHSHLDGIYPAPVVYLICCYHCINRSFDIFNAFFFFIYQVQINISLAATLVIGISYFNTAAKFLDESLVARRNSICHGESVDLDLAAYESVEFQVLDLMERVKDHSLDSAQNRKFLK